jgi:hypothetical protein
MGADLSNSLRVRKNGNRVTYETKKKPFRKPAQYLPLHCLFVLFGWPLLSLVDSHPARMFIYVTWGIDHRPFLHERSYNSPASGKEKPPDNRNPDA